MIMNEYETIYILSGNVPEEAVIKLQKRVEDVVSKKKGTIFAQKSQGSRNLAYPIRHESRGQYVQLNFAGDGGVVDELERNLRIFRYRQTTVD